MTHAFPNESQPLTLSMSDGLIYYWPWKNLETLGVIVCELMFYREGNRGPERLMPRAPGTDTAS